MVFLIFNEAKNGGIFLLVHPQIIEIFISIFSGIIIFFITFQLQKLIAGPEIVFEGLSINSFDDFYIHLRNCGTRTAYECIVMLDYESIDNVDAFLKKFELPTGSRIGSYFLENLDTNILFSCWPITRDVILWDMTDMKPGVAYDFTGKMPEFMKKKRREMLKPGDLDRVITLPKKTGTYIIAITVYDSVDISFILVYQYREDKKFINWRYVGSIKNKGKLRYLRIVMLKMKLKFVLWKLRRSSD